MKILEKKWLLEKLLEDERCNRGIHNNNYTCQIKQKMRIQIITTTAAENYKKLFSSCLLLPYQNKARGISVGLI